MTWGVLRRIGARLRGLAMFRRRQRLTPLENARRVLRAAQLVAIEKRAPTLGPRASGLEDAIEVLRSLTGYEDTVDPRRCRRGSFTYDRILEDRRIKMAEEIIRRVEPGPHEDAGLFAGLAYQAASLEVSTSDDEGSGEQGARWSQVILGIIPSTDVNAFAQRTASDGFTIIKIHLGLIEFLFQTAKTIVAAINPISPDGGSVTTAQVGLDYVRSRLRTDPTPARALYKLLEAMFYKGQTRFRRLEVIPLSHHSALSILVGMSERFILAHEYGHGNTYGLVPANLKVRKGWVPELLADAYGVVTTVESAYLLDRLPPEFPLAGAHFTLACAEVLRRAHSVVHTGRYEEDPGSWRYPPFSLRAGQLERVFRTHFDVQYDDVTGGCKLTIAHDRREPATVDESVRGHLRAVGRYSDILFLLWDHARIELEKNYRSDRPVHSSWEDAKSR